MEENGEEIVVMDEEEEEEREEYESQEKELWVAVVVEEAGAGRARRKTMVCVRQDETSYRGCLFTYHYRGGRFHSLTPGPRGITGRGLLQSC